MMGLWRRKGYRPTMRLLHRFHLHHTRTIGPLEPDGGYVETCDWCGVGRQYGGFGWKYEKAPTEVGASSPRGLSGKLAR